MTEVADQWRQDIETEGRGELEDAGSRHDPDHNRDVRIYRLPTNPARAR